jgi:hypothetical protein
MDAADVEEVKEARREAVPVIAVALALLAVLAIASAAGGWELLEGVRWWVWLVVAVPLGLLALHLWFAPTGRRYEVSRRIALGLLILVGLANLGALAILIAGLVTTETRNIGGGELLLSAAAIWTTNVIVFGIWFWEIDGDGPVKRALHERAMPDFQFPQDENPELKRPGWKPDAWDYFYVSLTNSIAFSPTDVMPLTHRAKLGMGMGSSVSALTVLLVAARAVNVLGS